MRHHVAPPRRVSALPAFNSPWGDIMTTQTTRRRLLTAAAALPGPAITGDRRSRPRAGWADPRGSPWPNSIPLPSSGAPTRAGNDRASTDAHDELVMMGLHKVVQIAKEVADLKKSRFDEPTWPTTSRYCRESAERDRKKWEAERQQRLSKAA